MSPKQSIINPVKVLSEVYWAEDHRVARGGWQGPGRQHALLSINHCRSVISLPQEFKLM